MKKLFFLAMLLSFAGALNAQEFYRITDIDDNDRGL